MTGLECLFPLDTRTLLTYWNVSYSKSKDVSKALPNPHSQENSAL